MKKLDLQAAQAIPVGDVVGVINGGIQFVDAVAPIAKVLFNKIDEFIKSLNIGKNNPNSVVNVRKRIAVLEEIAKAMAAKDLLQKEVNKGIIARLEILEKSLSSSSSNAPVS
jgi:hypothetical protein